MKIIVAVLALVLVLQTAFILSQGQYEANPGNPIQTEYKALTTEVERLSAEVAALKARVSALEEGSATLDLSNTSTSRPDPTPHCVVNRERVNVREGPGIAFASIGTVSQGERFDVQGSDTVGDWYLFCCVGGRSGWIYAPLLICTDDVTIPVAKDIPTPPTNTPRTFAKSAGKPG